jgi:DNA-binding FrmR family transcriptional regulator
MYPNHEEQLLRLNKIEGQLKGIRKMIEDRRYCVDILTQTKAVRSAIKKVELGVLKSHIQHCIKDAVNSDDPIATEEKIQEIVKLFEKSENL